MAAKRRPPASTRAAHSVGVIAFLHEALNRPVPFLAINDEVLSETIASEGQRIGVLVNRYERDPNARRICLEHHGTNCSICGMSFFEKYGEAMRGFIHAHHLVPVSSIGVAHAIDPRTDLIPVCPNCHAFLHRCDAPLPRERARALLRGNSNEQ